jgi:hypothetical protein
MPFLLFVFAPSPLPHHKQTKEAAQATAGYVQDKASSGMAAARDAADQKTDEWKRAAREDLAAAGERAAEAPRVAVGTIEKMKEGIENLAGGVKVSRDGGDGRVRGGG